MTAEASKGRMNREQVLELVRLQLADILEISPDDISESSSFSEDLNADSLVLIELVELLEEELRNQVADFRIDDEDLEDLRALTVMGCATAHGTLFARPMSAPQFAGMLRRGELMFPTEPIGKSVDR